MALRFQRRIKIAPGLRLNISGSGISTTVGGRGLSVTTGRRGTYANFGLPGTGISTRQKVSGRKTAKRRATKPTPSTVRFVADDEGNCFLLNAEGQQLSTSEAAAVRKAHGERLRESLQKACDDKNTLLHAITSAHLETPSPSTTPSYAIEAFPIAQPRQSMFQKFLSALLKSHKAKHEQLVQDWRSEKAEWDKTEQERFEEETQLVFTSIPAIDSTLSRYLSAIEWPSPPAVSYDVGDNIHTIALDVQLPEEQEMPETEWTVPARQYRLSAKKLTATKQRQLYRDYIHGIVFRLAGEVFARLPTIDKAALSAYREIPSPATGSTTEQYVLSVIITRSAWEQINFAAVEHIKPAEALDRFLLRRKMTSTGIFKEVVPFTSEELEDA
ncbi:MAG: hypothetical protein CMK85_09895 [Pseudomonadales bacterium]|jgi:hypothetical protein|nr:hypothetical protein [Pseudomonadales bacterium]|tara:strand:+ start:5629 stop:6786 length:1158 start_codon:yes stop_codon:yes gene_type:complete